MNIPGFITCPYCNTYQKTGKDLSCVECGAPMKPQEDFSIVRAILSGNVSFMQSLNDEICSPIVDVSKWQGNINPSIYASSDAKYMIIKSSQGIAADPKYQQNLQMCLQYEFPFGLYHYMDVRVGADLSAKYWADQFLAIPKVDFCKVRAWLDVENTFGFDRNQMRNYIRDFLRILELRCGVKADIYTRATFWDNYVAPMDEIHERKGWFAHFNSYISEPWVPKDWKDYGETWELWQWSADGNMQGHEYGMESWSLDLSRYNGTCEDFREAFIGTTVIVDPEPVDPPVTPCDDVLKMSVINTNSLRVRNQPSTQTGQILYNMTLGTTVTVKDIICRTDETWIQIGDNEYCAMWYHGSQYLEKIEEGE